MSPNAIPSHAPVLTEEVISHLAVRPGGRYVDCTLGPGGHSRAILEAASPGGVLLGLDADPAAVKLAAEALSEFAGSVRLVNSNFRDLGDVCNRYEFHPVHGVLFDLGVSSLQLGSADRGFSFQTEAPLDMRFGPDQEMTAADIVNEWPETDLANVIWRYGEERLSRRIARRIVAVRPIATTTELAGIVAKAVPAHGKQRIHPATRTFQALRIAVNDELGAIEKAIYEARDILGTGGRLVVIAFHSLEDRIVKQFMQRESRNCICPPEVPACVCDHRASLKVITKRPVKPSDDEIASNPRSRSARLRAAELLPVERD